MNDLKQMADYALRAVKDHKHLLPGAETFYQGYIETHNDVFYNELSRLSPPWRIGVTFSPKESSFDPSPKTIWLISEKDIIKTIVVTTLMAAALKLRTDSKYAVNILSGEGDRGLAYMCMSGDGAGTFITYEIIQGQVGAA